MPTLWSSAEALSQINSSGLKEHNPLGDQKPEPRWINFSLTTQRHSSCCRGLRAVFLSSPPLLLMLLIMIFHQQDRFRQPSLETLPLISPQKTCGSPAIFTDCKHSLLLIISPVLSVLLLPLSPNQPACTHAYTNTRHPSEPNIIGQRFEITASPTGEGFFFSRWQQQIDNSLCKMFPGSLLSCGAAAELVEPQHSMLHI